MSAPHNATQSAPGSASAEWRSFWFLPLVAALGYATSVIHIYGIGPYIAPLQHEFNWTRAQVSFGITVASCLSAIFCIPIGMLVDRIGPRRVGLLGVLLMCGALATVSTATGSKANWIMLWAILALGTLCVHTTVWTSAVASRFTQSRGLALAVTLSGASVGVIVFPLLATSLIAAYGWRTSFMLMAAIWAAIVFPLVLLFFRGAKDRARTRVVATATTQAALTGATFAEGIRSPALYKLLIAAGMFAFTLIGVLVHFVPILTDSGAAPMQAAGIASLIGIFSIVGRLSTGMLLDKFPAHLVGGIAFLIPILACLLLLFDGANHVSQALAAAIVGLTVGSEVDVVAYLAAKHFGLKNFGALYGVLQMALMFGTAFGPLAAGVAYDHYGSYRPFLMLTIALMTVSSIALLSMKSAPSTYGEAVHAS